MSELCQLSDLIGLELAGFDQLENKDRDRPEWNNRYLKAGYFFLREGILSTLKKYRAHSRKQVRYLTFVWTLHKGEKYLNISVQSQKDPMKFVLLNEFYRCPVEDIIPPADRVDEYLERYNQYCPQTRYDELGLDVRNCLTYPVKENTEQGGYERGLIIYGLGGYVRMFITQHFKHFPKIACIDYKPEVATDFKKRYGFERCFFLPARSYPLLARVKEPVVIISTYHSDHAPIAEQVFRINPAARIFIEKPPTVTLQDLETLITLYREGAKIEMGFNRRFIRFSHDVKRVIGGRRAIITCTVKEVNINPNHWYFWKNQGTRVTGNVVHWFDLANFWLESTPVEINVLSFPDDHESSAISVLYEDGSLVNITASDEGNSLRGVQEKLEIRVGNETVFINDFQSMVHLKQSGWHRKRRTLLRKKGHAAMYRTFKRMIHGEGSSDYTVDDLIRTSLVTYHASVMLKEGIRNRSIGQEIKKYREMVSL